MPPASMAWAEPTSAIRSTTRSCRPIPINPGQFTTDVIDSMTGQRVMVPVVDAAGNPVVVERRHAAASRADRAQSARPLCRALPSHGHRSEATTPATISDSSVVDSPGWGIVNHSSNVDVDGTSCSTPSARRYVTEAGDEIGTFNGNIAIHSLGSGAGIESRQAGAGLWPSGERLLAARGQCVGDEQRRLGPARRRLCVLPARAGAKGTGHDADSGRTILVNPAWAAAGQTMIDVGSVPLREFKGNVSFASGDGLETWFTLLDVSGKNADQRNVIENFTTFGNSSGRGIFTPYTNLTTLKNVDRHRQRQLAGRHRHWPQRRDAQHGLRSRACRGLGRRHRRAGQRRQRNQRRLSLTTSRDILISTANSRSRVVNINGNTDAQGNLDPTQPQFGTLERHGPQGRARSSTSR